MVAHFSWTSGSFYTRILKKDNISFVLVYKLSRFGRNTVDILSSIKTMKNYGVHLISKEEGLNSGTSSGRLMIPILSAIAEIERENILTQTMSGRMEKARQGRWNGGFPPYGYKLVDGELQIEESEAEIIKIIFEKYAKTTHGAGWVARYLEAQGKVKKIRQNGKLSLFSEDFIKDVLDNPVYIGKIAYGRRKRVVKEQATKEDDDIIEYHTVKQEEYPIFDGIHKAIIDEDLWTLAQEKRKINAYVREKKHSLDHANILSGILKCPMCGASMYGNVNRKKKLKKDGTYYKDHFYYVCKHRAKFDGVKCDYKKQWGQDKINAAVEEVILKLVNNAKFEEAIKTKIGSKIDTTELENELTTLNKKRSKVINAKDRLGSQIDMLDLDDDQYELKYSDMQDRLFKLYDDIKSIGYEIEEVERRIENIQTEKIKAENIYKILTVFDKVYSKFSDMDKKLFISSFVERVEIYTEEQDDGHILKSIKFKFPLYFNGLETNEICWDKHGHGESVVLLSHKNS